MNIKVNDIYFKILNIYAHSGSNLKKEREELFAEEMLFYLQGNLDNVIIGGDFNSITNAKDTSHLHAYLLSNNMKYICKDLKLYDIHDICNKGLPQYTFIKNGYGSRLDKFYVNKLKYNLNNFETIPVSFSDHHAVIFDLVSTNVIKFYPCYWKFNASFVDDKDIFELFKESWNIFQNKKIIHSNILEWWENIKKDVANLFIKIGKSKSAEKYGLLNLLENQLKEVNYLHQVNPNQGYEEILSIKARINVIKDKSYEGIKIRARINDKIKGEKLSSYLIGKQKLNSDNYISALNYKNNLITDSKAISIHASSYYKELYSTPNINEIYDQMLLENFKSVIDEGENALLVSPISEMEVKNVITKMNLNKSPGTDGLTVEFYIAFWPIIKYDLINIMNALINLQNLTTSQSSGIVTLFHKGGDKTLLENWRPITLLCVDYKIFTKILVSRIKPLLSKFISKEQFCSVPGKSIINCNILIRDILYYVIENDLEFAMVNLDFKQAFDKVDVRFIFKTLEALGFCVNFINCIRMLYTNITSRLKINNVLGDPFPVQRGVRQGCPLSMILFIIYQEALYRLIKKSSLIRPLHLPNNKEIKLTGYADDSNVFITRESDLNALFDIINKFSSATGAEINTNKTQIMGFGKWRNKTNWPVDWLSPEVKRLKCLGIYFYSNWKTSVQENWLIIESKIQKFINCIMSRLLTIFQKSIYINSCIISKMIYISHVIPIDEKIGKRITTIIFNYLWNGTYHPIKRDNLYLPKEKGGIGIANIITKCNCTLLRSFLKIYTENDELFHLMWYYCDIRLSAVLPKNINNVCYSMPPYYTYTINLCNKLLNNRTFPNVTGKEIYLSFSQSLPPEVELLYPLYKWKSIWKNINSNYIDKYDRVVCYKFIYNVLPTKKKLKSMNITGIDTELCSICNEPESNMHLFYFCKKIRGLYHFALKICEILCKKKFVDPFAFIFFDFRVSKLLESICSLVNSSYIGMVWTYRNESLGMTTLKRKLIAKIKYNTQTVLMCSNMKGNSRQLFADLDKRCENLKHGILN